MGRKRCPCLADLPRREIQVGGARESQSLCHSLGRACNRYANPLKVRRIARSPRIGYMQPAKHCIVDRETGRNC